MTLFDDIQNALQQQRPFVIYNKAGSDRLKAIIQQNDQVYYSDELNESGFVFAPFLKNTAPILIPLAESICKEVHFNPQQVTVQPSTITDLNSAAQQHIQLVKKAVETIESGAFQKVVLSRSEVVSLRKGTLLSIFERLLHSYPNAFTYLWYHPKIGLWSGATPETLVTVNNKEFRTMALAGTQVYRGSTDVEWGAKEIEEQQMVTEYICEQLSSLAPDLHCGPLHTAKAGSLLHLKTMITGTYEGALSTLVNRLHPTPAVCGLPKEAALDFIKKHENYSRKYYTGYLGEVDIEKQTELFVNLRCMELETSKATLYIGGGITVDSIPENEWEETVAKSKVMKQVL